MARKPNVIRTLFERAKPSRPFIHEMLRCAHFPYTVLRKRRPTERRVHSFRSARSAMRPERERYSEGSVTQSPRFTSNRGVSDPSAAIVTQDTATPRVRSSLELGFPA